MKKFLKIITAVLALTIVIAFCYFLPYSKAQSFTEIPETVKVSNEKEGLFYDGPGNDKLLILYPGAKVDTKAYEPVMSMLAEDGIDCFVIDMPLHFAFFNINGADKILNNYDYKNYYIAGHSLGGAMAANYLAKDDNWKKFEGIIFLASYSANDLKKSTLRAVSIYGSNDGVLNISKVKEGRKYFKDENYSEEVIQGGNHAQFGNYGKQSGDNTAEISPQKQWEETVKIIENFVK